MHDFRILSPLTLFPQHRGAAGARQIRGSLLIPPRCILTRCKLTKELATKGSQVKLLFYLLLTEQFALVPLIGQRETVAVCRARLAWIVQVIAATFVIPQLVLD